MIKTEKTHVYGLSEAVQAMRNPFQSWKNSDTSYSFGRLVLGEKDKTLAQSLIKSGSEHRKFLRQIFVTVQITAPEYWWMQFDTYKVGVTSSSESKMHTLLKRPFLLSDFATDGSDFAISSDLAATVSMLNDYRNAYLQEKKSNPAKSEEIWRGILQSLPMSYIQMRSVTMDYENVLTICRQRKNHKLTEWREFVSWAHTLPCANELLFFDEPEKRG